MTARILPLRRIGLPFSFLDLSALRLVSACECDVWKKWSGSVERDITSCRWVARAKGSRLLKLVKERCHCRSPFACAVMIVLLTSRQLGRLGRLRVGQDSECPPQKVAMDGCFFLLKHAKWKDCYLDPHSCKRT